LLARRRLCLGDLAFAIAVSFEGRKETAMANFTSNRFPFQELDVYRAAREVAALVHRASISDRSFEIRRRVRPSLHS